MSDSEANNTVAYETMPDPLTLQVLQDLANRLRIRSIKAACALSSGHPTSCSSAAEILSVLFFHVMRYKKTDPENPNNDRFVLYKRLPFIDTATGSVGQGLGAACGMAYTGKYFDKASYRVFCLVGDGESSEGCVWEALAFASHYNLDNLVAIFDVNRLGTLPLEHCMDVYQKRCEAFGWNTFVADGRDVEALCQVFWQATQVKNKPTAIVAKTFKGRGIPSVEDAENWHGKPMPQERADAIIKLIESQIETDIYLEPKTPIEDAPEVNITNIGMTSPPSYKIGDVVATRKACGLALAKLGHEHDRVVVLDSDTKNSTFSEIFKKEHPERFIECCIAEQNMVSVALGCSTRDRTIVFASTFAAFLTRAFDQIRIGAISKSNINLIGSHCGISIGENIPSQMALEDLAMFRTIPNCTIFYPSDAVSTEHAVFLAARTKGVCYIRTTRPATAVIYSQHESFAIGKAKVIRRSDDDKVTVIGAGITLHEVLEAAEELSNQGVYIRIIDLFTVKPLDSTTIIANAKSTGGYIITVEDHYPEGGIGEAVCAAVSMEPDIRVCQLAVLGLPRGGRSSELLDMFGVSARHIVMAVKCVLMN